MYLRNLAKGTLRPNCSGRVTSDQGAMIAYDGERGYGQVVARAATEIGIEPARRTGFAVVALRNAHHIGRIGAYGEMCAEAGLVSIHFVNITDQKPSVAPSLGGDARFGTNPVCVAVPAAEQGRPTTTAFWWGDTPDLSETDGAISAGRADVASAQAAAFALPGVNP
jgi:uncharacterized oxidoreductase